jgi:hypothetical protein
VHDLFAVAQDALLEQLAAATVQDAARGTDEQLRASA